MIEVIGLMGISQSGKDTAANALKAHIENEGGDTIVERIAFARPIKLGSQAILDFTEDQLHDPVLKNVVDQRYGFTPRDVFKAIGDALRALDDEIFLTILKDQLEKFSVGPYQGMDVVVIVTDVRFPIEVDFLRKTYDAKIIGISRPSLGEPGEHGSEKNVDLSLADRVVKNDVPKKQYEFRILDTYEELTTTY